MNQWSGGHRTEGWSPPEPPTEGLPIRTYSPRAERQIAQSCPAGSWMGGVRIGPYGNGRPRRVRRKLTTEATEDTEIGTRDLEFGTADRGRERAETLRGVGAWSVVSGPGTWEETCRTGTKCREERNGRQAHAEARSTRRRAQGGLRTCGLGFDSSFGSRDSSFARVRLLSFDAWLLSSAIVNRGTLSQGAAQLFPCWTPEIPILREDLVA
jgi:hypothetical protein